MTIKTIAVGVDRSENARRACDWAAALAASLRAELVVVHAVGLLEHASRESADGWVATLDAPNAHIRRLLRDGSPASVLEAVVAEVAADLLVVGSRGVGGALSSVLGSTSAQVVQTAVIPVVVVPGNR